MKVQVVGKNTPIFLNEIERGKLYYIVDGYHAGKVVMLDVTGTAVLLHSGDGWDGIKSRKGVSIMVEELPVGATVTLTQE